MITKNLIGDKYIEITKNDIEIFKLLNKFGFLRKSTLYKYHTKNDTPYANSYFSKRANQLQKAGYLKSIGHHFGLTTKAKKELLLREINVHYGTTKQRISDTNAIKVSKHNDILLKLPFKNILSRVEYLDELRKDNNFAGNIKTYIGIAYNELSKKYLIYNTDVLTTNYLSRINTDLKNSNIRYVIVFVKDLDNCLSLKKQALKLPCYKLLVLQADDNGFNMLKLYLNNLLTEKIIVSYLNFASNNLYNGKIENNIIHFDNKPYFNSFILDLAKPFNPYAFFLFEECYENLYRKSERAIDNESTKNSTIKITLEKYIDFLKNNLNIII